MANSDNVVRAGLTPKFMDVQVLLNILTYEDSPGSAHKVTPTYFNSSKTVMLYDAPVDEFSVLRHFVSGKEDSFSTVKLTEPSIIICVAGAGVISCQNESDDWEERGISLGDSFFVASRVNIKLKNQAGESPLECFQAFSKIQPVNST